MPSWNIHLEAGNRIADKLKMTSSQRQEFLVGCLLPDINNGYINSPNVVKPHEETHYVYDQKSSLNFYAENSDKINAKDPLYLGYLLHLYTDGFFNYDYYRNIKRHPLGEGKTDEDKLNIKHHDFWLYDTNFHHVFDLSDKDAATITKKANNISAVQLSAEDIKDALGILSRNDINDKIRHDSYIFYTKEALDNLLEDMCESFTNDYLSDTSKEYQNA